MNISNLTIKEAKLALANKEISSVDLTTHYLDVIKKKNPKINAYLSTFEEFSINKAKEADKSIKEGKSGPLTGIPLAIKDNILVKNFFSTAGSKILEKYKSSYDATVTKKLKNSEAIILGKTNLDEFAMGSSTENSAYGPTKNPNDISRVAGGSSGGSCAAVAAEMCLGALGSDTGGSIRQPASFCGVVGLKPTYGSVSRYGLIALASSLDQIGPITKTVEDAKIIYSAIAEKDLLDSTSFASSFTKTKKENIKDLNIGIPLEYFKEEGLDPKVKEIVEEKINWFEKQGANIKEISLSSSSYGLSVYYIIMPAEASSNLARYDGVRYGYSKKEKDLFGGYESTRKEGFGEEATRRIMVGTYVLSAGYYNAYYKKAKSTQHLIRQDFESSFKDIDVIITPTTPTTAFKLGEKTDNPLEMYAADIFTVPVNIAGLPAISIPCGETNNLPVGLQIIAPWHQEDLLFKVGMFFEQNYKN